MSTVCTPHTLLHAATTATRPLTTTGSGMRTVIATGGPATAAAAPTEAAAAAGAAATALPGIAAGVTARARRGGVATETRQMQSAPCRLVVALTFTAVLIGVISAPCAVHNTAPHVHECILRRVLRRQHGHWLSWCVQQQARPCRYAEWRPGGQAQ